ncbi:hypothetical protein [Cedecea sp. NFIX57]|uniref:hypothetical protein n=1 Tax=Cedecea sp. NFIX57 TaxID=1566286 RepID=UPI0015934647|nr:hypothetical protein [Cedecea sp. NFIX57]
MISVAGSALSARIAAYNEVYTDSGISHEFLTALREKSVKVIVTGEEDESAND